jgi:hypothetical protein
MQSAPEMCASEVFKRECGEGLACEGFICEGFIWEGLACHGDTTSGPRQSSLGLPRNQMARPAFRL